MKALLANSNPHPFAGAREYLYSDWWGREIELGAPEVPHRSMGCGTHTIWPVTGPHEFVAVLKKYGLGQFVCAHMLGEVLGK